MSMSDSFMVVGIAQHCRMNGFSEPQSQTLFWVSGLDLQRKSACAILVLSVEIGVTQSSLAVRHKSFADDFAFVLGRDSASKPSHARVWNPRLLVWEDQGE